jgi:hypothetical protein
VRRRRRHGKAVAECDGRARVQACHLDHPRRTRRSGASTARTKAPISRDIGAKIARWRRGWNALRTRDERDVASRRRPPRALRSAASCAGRDGRCSRRDSDARRPPRTSRKAASERRLGVAPRAVSSWSCVTISGRSRGSDEEVVVVRNGCEHTFVSI